MSAGVKLENVKRGGQLLKALRAGLAAQLVVTFLVLLVLGRSPPAALLIA